MSGHSKWHNIQAKKGVEDAKRGRAFTKITREIIIAAKAGGGSTETNTRLRAAVEKAKSAGMPNDNVKKAIMRLSLIHISEPTRLGMISYAVFCLKKKKKQK